MVVHACEFKTGLGYRRSCIKKTQNKQKPQSNAINESGGQLDPTKTCC